MSESSTPTSSSPEPKNPPPSASASASPSSGDQGINIILVITLALISLLFLEEARPDLVARWLQWPVVASSDVQALSRAIISQESDDNYGAINPHSGALGYAQIMPENLPEWSRSALGREVTIEEFLADPDLQHKIIEHRLTLYWQEALVDSRGNKDEAVLMVASRWYSGDPDLYESQRPQYYDGYEYPSIAEYSNRILRKWKRQREPWDLF